MKLVSWNVTYSPQTCGQFYQFDWKRRAPYVLGFVAAQDADIVCLQEVHDSYKPEQELLAQNKTAFLLQSNPRGMNNMTIVPKDWDAVQLQVPICETVESPRQCILAVYIPKFDLVIINLHFPTAEWFRSAYTKHLATYVNTLKHENVIITGDWNTFPDVNGPQQIQKFLQTARSPLSEATHYMVNNCGERVLRSFEAYPYDRVPQTEPYHFDHIMVTRSIRYRNVVCHNDRRPLKVDGKAWHPSDHFAITMEFDIVGDQDSQDSQDS